MKRSAILRKIIHRAVKENYAFALWFLPGEDLIRGLVQEEDEVVELKKLNDLQDRQGFVFAPFDRERHPVLLLGKGHYFKTYESIEKWAERTISDNNVTIDTDPLPGHSSKQDYLQQCNSLIRKIKTSELAKVVLSRQKIIDRKDVQKDPGDIFIDLKKSHPEAFCYLFYSSRSGMWMGASPEILMQEKQDHYLSIALAGTRQNSYSGYQNSWPEKDIKEQKFVSDYISEKLKESGVEDFSISGPKTHRAGQVEHLRTDFRIAKSEARTRLGLLLEKLHPTPAVCGTPAQQALQLIRQTEKHDRAYYCGFFGPLNLDESVNLYVNLRSMEIQQQAYILYAGGGILEDSVAENEWNETELKAKTLLNVILDKKATL